MTGQGSYTALILFRICLFSPILLISSGHGQDAEAGLPFIRNYLPREYNTGFDNWSILQDRRGVMYFGNLDGILEFDGVSWRLIKIPNGNAVRSLAMDDDGRIYVAATSDFGYLAPDSAGQLKFNSLRKYFGEGHPKFGDVWSVRTTSDGVFFKTADQIYRWQGERIKIWDSVKSFRVYTARDTIYVRKGGIGLMKIDGDSLVMAPGGETFAHIGVYNMIPFPASGPGESDKILLTTNRNGLYLYDGVSFETFKTGADTFLLKNQIYNGAMLPDSSFAFATQRGGVAIIDRQGRLLQIINEFSGLASQVVYDVFPDRQGGLWLAMEKGLARVETPSPFSRFGKNLGISSIIESALHFGDRLYVADQLGLRAMGESPVAARPRKFMPVPAIDKPGSYLLAVDGKLLAATNGGVFLIEKDGGIEELADWAATHLCRSAVNPNRVYVGTMGGLFLLEKKANRWFPGGQITDFKDDIILVLEDGNGDLWLQGSYPGIVRMRGGSVGPAGASPANFIAERYDYGVEIPFRVLRLFSIDGEVLFATDQGLKRFDPVGKRFFTDSSFWSMFADSSRLILGAVEDSHQRWIVRSYASGHFEIGTMALEENGQYRWHADYRLNRLDLKNIFNIYPEKKPDRNNDVLWISVADELIRYDPDIRVKKKPQLPPLIRRVVVGRDSVIFWGTASSAGSLGEHRNSRIPYEDNSILFEFAAPDYDQPSANQYQFFLEGIDKTWSGWTTEYRKEYTHLPGGDYRFRVRTRNIYGAVSEEAVFGFGILPPWYRSWTAYLFFAGVFLFILYISRHLELKRIRKKQQQELELVELRKIKELDQLKSRFFTNISHEFRTPLTLILGQVESVMNLGIDKKGKSRLQVALRNARRLLLLINQLLELSRLEAGGMTLKKKRQNIVTFLKSLTASFEMLAEQKNITLVFEAEQHNIPAEFEADKMEKIFTNLLGNAFKFIPEGGSVIVDCRLRIAGLKDKFKIRDPKSAMSNFVEITVRDTGPGIPPEAIPHIFDRFYQVEDSDTRVYEGSGIGLALGKELVELHGGSISVASELGKGAKFTILLPAALSEGAASTGQDAVFDMEKPVLLDSDEAPVSYQQNQASDREPLADDREIILIVEDNPDVRAYIREQLEAQYAVIEAANGEEGIAAAQEVIPDLIITDIMMPKMDGYELSKRIREDEKTSHIPIIMLTAKAALDDKIEGLETGADAYLVKPFSAKELTVRVRNLILQRQQLRRRFSRATVIKPSEVAASSIDQVFLEKVLALVEERFGDKHFNVECLAVAVHMSVSQLNRKLGALIDQPAGQLIRSLRLQRAADLLKQNAGTIAEICYQVGFSDQANFTRAFRKQFGVAPSDFRKHG